MTETGLAPRQQRINYTNPAVATATTVAAMIGEAQENSDVSSVSYTPNAAITGQNTNTRRLRVINRGQDGTGSTVIAELQYNAGTNGVAGDEQALTLQASANLEVNTGDIIAFESAAIGTGLADPGGLVQVILDRE